jgi:predicted amidohydrolase
MGATRAAVVQHAPVFLDREASVDKALALIAEAAANAADLVVFGETWLPCYPAWVFGSAAWDDAAAKQAYARLLDNGVEIPSETTDRLCAAAREHRVHVAIGVNERQRGSNGSLFNSLLFLSPAGEILGVHRKLVPTHAERLVWARGDGSTLHVFDTPIGRLGGLICWEHWMPLARFAMHTKGEQIHVAAWPDAPENHHLASRHYAFEGRCFVICASTFLTLDMIPPDLKATGGLNALEALSEAEGVVLSGGSGIIGPDGNWIAGPAGDEEVIVYGEMDLARIGEEFQALDTAGHYNRPDVFQLTVDARPREQVVWVDADETGDGDARDRPPGSAPAP